MDSKGYWVECNCSLLPQSKFPHNLVALKCQSTICSQFCEHLPSAPRRHQFLPWPEHLLFLGSLSKAPWFPFLEGHHVPAGVKGLAPPPAIWSHSGPVLHTFLWLAVNPLPGWIPCILWPSPSLTTPRRLSSPQLCQSLPGTRWAPLVQTGF